jgi:hypothetical protein
MKMSKSELEAGHRQGAQTQPFAMRQTREQRRRQWTGVVPAKKSSHRSQGQARPGA